MTYSQGEIGDDTVIVARGPVQRFGPVAALDGIDLGRSVRPEKLSGVIQSQHLPRPDQCNSIALERLAFRANCPRDAGGGGIVDAWAPLLALPALAIGFLVLAALTLRGEF